MQSQQASHRFCARCAQVAAGRGAEQTNTGIGCEGLAKAAPAVTAGRRRLRTLDQHDVSLPAQCLDEHAGNGPAHGDIVRADEGNKVALYAIDEADQRNTRSICLGYRLFQEVVIGGSKNDSIGPFGDDPTEQRDLLDRVVRCLRKIACRNGVVGRSGTLHAVQEGLVVWVHAILGECSKADGHRSSPAQPK
jgi:hypothetical protein